MVKKKSCKHVFVFLNAPDAPHVAIAAFPISMIEDAKSLCDTGNGYYELRYASWPGYGKFPERADTTLNQTV